MTQPENLNQGPEGQVSPAEPLIPPTETAPPQAYGKPIAPAVDPYQQPPQIPGPVIAPAVGAYQQPPQIPGPVIAPVSATFQPPMPNQQAIIVNQAIPQVPLKLRSSPAVMVCPHCHNTITTVVDTQFSCLNCCFCYCMFICWVIVNLVNEKDFNCTDATHKCPQCGQVIYQYNAC